MYFEVNFIPEVLVMADKDPFRPEAAARSICL
jgi:hypothetical protein